MILTDAGPLIAILDEGEPEHERCAECLRTLTGPMVTPWPAFTEAMYLLGEGCGHAAEEALWEMVSNGVLLVDCPSAGAMTRMRQLMLKYRSLPMDLADAALVATAEERGLRDIFTLDRRGFSVYRLRERAPFRVWLAP